MGGSGAFLFFPIVSMFWKRARRYVRVKHVTQRVTFVTQHVRNSTCVSACQPAWRLYNHAPKYQNMPSRLSKEQGGAASVAEFRS